MGRPLIYRNKELTWNNQNQLLRINSDIKYQYDVNGIRACKLVKGLETRYITQNNQIICEENNNGIIIYQYILNKLVGFTYTTSSGTKKYLYIRNIQGDITSIIDSEGNKVCSYIYDGYGNHIVLNQDDNLENDPLSIGHINPFRYRGYYFDEESGLYYLNSRYYDPETGRFISPDVLSILDETKGQINGLNLYMYCGDNPIMYCDPSGNFAMGIAAVSIAVYYLLIGIGLITLGAMSYIASQGGFQNVSFDIPYEWQIAWNNFGNNIFDALNNVSNWWGKIFYPTTNTLSQNFTMSSSLDLIDYYLLVNNSDPYARPGQKKQGRELKNKARSRFTTKSKFRRGPKPPKHHTPGREHRKYLWLILWRILNHENDDWWDMD